MKLMKFLHVLKMANQVNSCHLFQQTLLNGITSLIMFGQHSKRTLKNSFGLSIRTMNKKAGGSRNATDRLRVVTRHYSGWEYKTPRKSRIFAKNLSDLVTLPLD